MSTVTKPPRTNEPVKFDNDMAPQARAIARLRDIAAGDRQQAANYRAVAKRAKEENEAEEVVKEALTQAAIFDISSKILEAALPPEKAEG